jgi:hypothetical protein
MKEAGFEKSLTALPLMILTSSEVSRIDPTSLDSNLDYLIEYSQKAIEINRLNRGAY